MHLEFGIWNLELKLKIETKDIEILRLIKISLRLSKSGIGNRESGIGNREPGIGKREPGNQKP
jgi:hypothetical protein